MEVEVDNVVAAVNGVNVPLGADNLKVPLVRVRKLVGRTAKVLVLISRTLELLVPMFMVIRLKKVVAPEPEMFWFHQAQPTQRHQTTYPKRQKRQEPEGLPDPPRASEVLHERLR